MAEGQFAKRWIWNAAWLTGNRTVDPNDAMKKSEAAI
jgi:hypothetical protein